MAKDFVTIVSGLPRSGTSMMMQMLEAAGFPALADGIREADRDNPKGYYEFEPVKQTKEDPSWVPGAVGKVVKMVYKLLYDLPQDQQYRVVFMRRNLDEVLASQKKMLDRLGRDGGSLADDRIKQLFVQQLDEFDQWIAGQPCFQRLDVNYKDVIENPREQIARLNEFLGGDLNVEAMAAVVEPTLYRNKA